MSDEKFFESAKRFYSNVKRYEIDNPMDLKFKDFRRYLSVIDRLSICERETLAYQNFANIREVPDTWDDCYVYGVGRIESEFVPEAYELDSRELQGRALGNRSYLLSCIEIMVSQKPRNEYVEGET